MMNVDSVCAATRTNVIAQDSGDGWAAYHGDCVEVCRGLPSDSIGYSIFSPPFASLYTYSASDRDMGNVRDHAEFARQFGFLVPELYRVTKPGRLLSLHCMLLHTSKARDGVIGLTDFRGDLIRQFCGDEAAQLYTAINRLRVRVMIAQRDGDMTRASKLTDAADVMDLDLRTHPGSAGFIFHSEVVIWKDPVTSMQRTKAVGLLHKTIRKDSAMSRQGIPDYLVTFAKPGHASAVVEADAMQPHFLVTMRKPGDNPEPIAHTPEAFPVELWQRYASPVWVLNDAPTPIPVSRVIRGLEGMLSSTVDGGVHISRNDVLDLIRQATRMAAVPTESAFLDCDPDINPSDTLQYRSAREEQDEKHICPLQLEVIRRGIRLWSNPGDVVLSPFGGIGSEGYVALQERRRVVTAELKASYYGQLVRNLRAAEPNAVGRTLDLFAPLPPSP